MPKPIVNPTAVSRSSDIHRRPFLPSLRANGSTTNPSATGQVLRPKGCPKGCTAALAGTETVRTTFVTPAPAATVDGENVAVAPAGSPLIENVSALPAAGGVTASLYVACPPGETVAVDDEPLKGAIEKVSTT
jgi:hypothetical protein